MVRDLSTDGKALGSDTDVLSAEDAVNQMLSDLRGDGCTVQPPQWGPGDETGSSGDDGVEGMRDDDDDGRSSGMGYV